MDKKIFVPILDNGGQSVRASYMMSFWTAFGGRPNVHVQRFSDSLVSRNRNAAASAFLNSDCTDLIFIDADMVFTKADVDHLLEHESPFVAGLYCQKCFTDTPIAQAMDQPEITQNPPTVRGRWVGAGFMRIRRDLLELMKQSNGGSAKLYKVPSYASILPQWDFFPSGVEADGDYFSEDQAFCERAHELGIDVLLDLRIIVGHEGSHIFRPQLPVQIVLGRIEEEGEHEVELIQLTEQVQGLIPIRAVKAV